MLADNCPWSQGGVFIVYVLFWLSITQQHSKYTSRIIFRGPNLGAQKGALVTTFPWSCGVTFLHLYKMDAAISRGSATSPGGIVRDIEHIHDILLSIS